VPVSKFKQGDQENLLQQTWRQGTSLQGFAMLVSGIAISATVVLAASRARSWVSNSRQSPRGLRRRPGMQRAPRPRAYEEVEDVDEVN